MQISLRSPLVAGTAAVVGATAIAMTPVSATHLQLPNLKVPSVEQVALSGYDSPLSELLLSLGVVNDSLFNANVGATPPLPWKQLSKEGLVPQVIADALPIIRELGVNGSDYLYVSGKGLGQSAYLVSEGVWNATGQLLSLNISGAIATLVTAVSNAGNLALATGSYVLANVINRATAVAADLAALVPDLIQGSINQVLVVAGAAAKIAQDTLAAVVALDPETAWNTAVNGLLGPDGLPGIVTRLAIGAGVVAPAPISGFVPSVRTQISTVVQTIKGGLATPSPVPPPVAAVASPAALREAAAVKPATAVVAGNEGGGGAQGASDNDNKSVDGAAQAGAVDTGVKAGKRGVGSSKRAAAKAASSAD